MAFQYELFNALRVYFHLPKVQMTEFVEVFRETENTGIIITGITIDHVSVEKIITSD